MKSVPPSLAESEEFKNASESVKRLFTLEFSRRSTSMDVVRRDMVKSVRRHQSDWGSFECTIAHMTAVIRNFQDAVSKNRQNKRMKVQLKELIDKRKKYLKYLRKSDYKRFEWLLEKLDLQYRPPPSNFHMITRKESLQKLADKYCEDLKQERLKAYKDQLESQKIDFLTEKVKKLKWIIEEEKACAVTPSVTQDEIDKVVSQLENLKMKKEMVKETVN
ncbi:28S ribosomal protein S15 [Gryllus bimaculatus]|nr:28S ribosomal protein S15 [Gryllus bimaculatus]